MDSKRSLEWGKDRGYQSVSTDRWWWWKLHIAEKNGWESVTGYIDSMRSTVEIYSNLIVPFLCIYIIQHHKDGWSVYMAKAGGEHQPIDWDWEFGQRGERGRQRVCVSWLGISGPVIWKRIILCQVRGRTTISHAILDFGDEFTGN